MLSHTCENELMLTMEPSFYYKIVTDFNCFSTTLNSCRNSNNVLHFIRCANA